MWCSKYIDFLRKMHFNVKFMDRMMMSGHLARKFGVVIVIIVIMVNHQRVIRHQSNYQVTIRPDTRKQSEENFGVKLLDRVVL